MKRALGHIGTLAFFLQIASVCVFSVLVHNEHQDPNWRPGAMLNSWQGTMLNVSTNTLLASGVAAVIGLIIPGSRMLAFITIFLFVPLVLIGGAFQGAS